MIRIAPALALAAAFSAAPLGAQAAQDFQLPPAATPTPEPRVQGPVDTEGPVAVRPRAIQTARPAPAPTPASTPSASPAIVLPAPATSRAAPVEPRRVTATPATGPALPAPTVSTPAAATEAGAVAPLPVPSTTTPPPSVAIPRGTTSSSQLEVSSERSSPPLFAIMGPAVLVLLGFGLFLWRRRRGPAPAPQVIAPYVPAAGPEPAEMLAIAVEAVRMDRSMMNATVGYRVTLRNRTARGLTGIAVEADLVSASRDRPPEAQLALPGQALTPQHTASRLGPGQSLRFEGQVRLPLAEASAIWQGRVGLLVPLLRVRALAECVAPVATTLVIGRSEGAAARPQPFRLDEPPRSYAPLAQRVVSAAA